ncbi:chain length determinant protein [Pontibacter mangrovi]|nr:chain length determinant protein [Pontibacter mangrovi]
MKEKDEIDLTPIFQALHRFSVRMRRSFTFALRAVRLHALRVGIITLIGVAAGAGFFKISKPYYTSSMTLVLAEIRNQFVENQLNRLSLMIEDENYEAVAGELDISPASARKIKEMTYTNLDENLVSEDSVLTGSPFEIELSLFDNKLLSSLEPALANYLEGNRYFSKQKLIKQREMESMIGKLKGEIAALDSIKTTAANPRGPVNGFVYGEPLDPSTLFRESIRMYEQQVRLEANLEQLDNIQIVNGFAPRLRPTGPKLLKYLAIGGGLAFLIGIIVALRLEKKRNRKLAV